MTLVFAAIASESIWLLTDRRLTWPDDRTRDDAVKGVFLDTPDAQAMLGYAGIGQVGETEPSDWMAAVLGNQQYTLKGALETVEAAMRRQLPRHMKVGMS
jgi:hypothetical protein